MSRGVRAVAIGAVAALLLAAGPCRAAESGDVVVFTLSTVPVRSDGATVHVLDARDRLAAVFGAELPSDAERAVAQAMARTRSAAGRGALRDLEAAAAGNARAGRRGVAPLPAGGVGGRHVVYGVTDVRQATELVSAWRAQHETRLTSGPGSTRSSLQPLLGTPPARSLPEARTP